jgi:hypothetical protein
VGWLTFKDDALKFTAALPRDYESSPGVFRAFCPRCGTPLTYRNARRPGEIDVTICSLDQPEKVVPADHIWMQDAPSWDRPADGLPQYPAGRGGT